MYATIFLQTHSRMGDGGKIWFSGKIDKKTGRVISAETGKIERQKSETDDGDDV